MDKVTNLGRGHGDLQSLLRTGHFLAPNHVFATVKHFAGHAVPENGSNTGPLMMGERTLRDQLLPPYQTGIQRKGTDCDGHLFTRSTAYRALPINGHYRTCSAGSGPSAEWSSPITTPSANLQLSTKSRRTWRPRLRCLYWQTRMSSCPTLGKVERPYRYGEIENRKLDLNGRIDRGIEDAFARPPLWIPVR